MTAPAKKRIDPTPERPLKPGFDPIGPSDIGDTDLETFRAMRPVSRRATAKELEKLIRPNP